MLKKAIKRVVGQERITRLKQSMRFVKDVRYLRNHKRIVCDEEDALYKKFAQGGKHVFFGYYDIQQFDSKEKKLLVHVVNKNANARRDYAELGYYDALDGSYTPFARTRAWCWQQGARLRWHPVNDDLVLYNDIDDGKYVTRYYDIKTGTVVFTASMALYDLDQAASYGLSLNFSRLQRLRPGYGYSALPDRTVGQPCPSDDGIFYVDLRTNQKSLIVSLEELAKQVSDPEAGEHYINHVSISPDGSRFMFFHIWTLKGDTHWRTRLCVYNLSDKKLMVLEATDRVSHYDWKNNDEILVTCWDKNKNQYYCVYDIEKGTKTRINDTALVHDGHPTYEENKSSFISDTYPLANDMQTLFEYQTDKDLFRPILHIYSDARLYEEKRCDLHPRLSKSEKYITIDTTFENGVKEVLLITNWRKENA